MTCEFYVEGMHCAACELLIEDKLSKVNGVKKVDAKLAENKVFIETDVGLDASVLSKLVKEYGYKIVAEKNISIATNFNQLLNAFLIALVIVIIFILIQRSGILESVNSDRISLPFAFVMGVIASLSSCMAVVGGLVLSISSTLSKENKIRPLVHFHISRLISFFIFGGIIGLLGSVFVLKPLTHFIINIILFFVMLVLGINLLGIFQKSKKFQIKVPKFVGKKIFRFQTSTSYFAPILLGAATFILPCGFTQVMQTYSLSTGSFLNGASTMFVFALGTFPVLALISFASVRFSRLANSALFFRTVGFIVIFFGFLNFAGALAAAGLIEPLFKLN